MNYDLGGEGVAFHAGDHIATKAGGGYRNDNTSASLGLTGWDEINTLRHDVWYMASATLEGTVYPTPTTHEFYIGAVQVNDWFNYTVNVSTAGTYVLSSTWSTGNGPPGGEGGDGSVGLQVYSNGTKVGEWHDTFPSYQTTADYQHWKPYPGFLTVVLPAGAQVIKIQSTTKHLHLGYVQFDFMGADGGVSAPADAGAGGAAGESGGAGSGGTAGVSGGGAGIGGAGDGWRPARAERRAAAPPARAAARQGWAPRARRRRVPPASRHPPQRAAAAVPASSPRPIGRARSRPCCSSERCWRAPADATRALRPRLVATGRSRLENLTR